MAIIHTFQTKITFNTAQMQKRLFITIILLVKILGFNQNTFAQCRATASNSGPYCPGRTIEFLAISGGTAYSWEGPNGFTDATANPTIPLASANAPNHSGTYTVTVTFANGCTASSTTLVQVNNKPNANAFSTGTYCQNTLVALNATGGGVGGRYVWQGPNSFASSLQNPALPNVGVSASGSYNVTVTNAFGCSATAATFINIFSPPIVSITQSGGTCAGNNLMLSAEPINGSQFDWTGPNSYTSTLQNPTLTNLSSNDNGNYNVNVTDANGCSASASTIVSVTTILVNATANSPICEGGALNLNATGGSTVAWTGPNAFSSSNPSPTIANIAAVNGGTYTAVVTNSSGCSNSTTLAVIVHANPTVSVTKTDATCYVANNGTATATVLSGVQPVTYNWSNGITNALNENLAPNTYTVIVSDANGCTTTQTAIVTEPFPLVVQVRQIINALCSDRADGGASAVVGGGTAPYTYLWSNGTGLNPVSNLPCGASAVTITDQNNCSTIQTFNILCPSKLQTTDTIAEDVKCFGGSTGVVRINMTGGTPVYTYDWIDLGHVNADSVANVAAGTYHVSVTDANGCPFGPVSITVREPSSAVSLTINGTAAICKNGRTGTATVIPSGGTPGYRYNWDSYAAGTTNPTAVSLPIGLYRVTVSDANACSQTAEYTITEPDSVKVTATAINTICYNDDNGFVLIDSVSGGNGGPYIYSLDNANFQPDTIFAGLPAGLYSVYASDSRGCLDTVQVRVFQPSPIQITIANGKAITIPMGEGVRLVTNVNVSPNTLNYVWTPRNDLTCESTTTCTQPFVQPLDPVRYTVLVTDVSNGCTASTSILVEVEKNRNIYIPNIITPNNDGYNDQFMIYGGLGVVKIHQLKIFDRWGEMVYGAADFMPNDARYSWDGWFKEEVMSPAVFVYYMEVEFIDGQVIPYKGDITLIR